MSWNFEAKDRDAYLLCAGSRAMSLRGVELGRVISIEPGHNSDQLKVFYSYFRSYI